MPVSAVLCARAHLSIYLYLSYASDEKKIQTHEANEKEEKSSHFVHNATDRCPNALPQHVVLAMLPITAPWNTNIVCWKVYYFGRAIGMKGMRALLAAIESYRLNTILFWYSPHKGAPPLQGLVILIPPPLLFHFLLTFSPLLFPMEEYDRSNKPWRVVYSFRQGINNSVWDPAPNLFAVLD